MFKDQYTDIFQAISPIIGDLYQWGKSYITKLTKPGMYEVISYDSTLEILDIKGKEAVFTKTEEIRFLQDNIIAFQDQAWGDGKILLDYQCSPGVPVDFYRNGHKTHVLISFREVKNKDDQLTMNIQWKIKDGFLTNDGYWGTAIIHSTRKLKVRIIFPRNRVPHQIQLINPNHKIETDFKKENLLQLPDKHWQVTWEKKNPKINQNYLIKWEW